MLEREQGRRYALESPVAIAGWMGLGRDRCQNEVSSGWCGQWRGLPRRGSLEGYVVPWRELSVFSPLFCCGYSRYFISFLEMGSHHEVQAGLELIVIFVPQSPKCRAYRLVPPPNLSILIVLPGLGPLCQCRQWHPALSNTFLAAVIKHHKVGVLTH